jgi:hypothetical protein
LADDVLPRESNAEPRPQACARAEKSGSVTGFKTRHRDSPHVARLRLSAHTLTGVAQTNDNSACLLITAMMAAPASFPEQ